MSVDGDQDGVGDLQPNQAHEQDQLECISCLALSGEAFALAVGVAAPEGGELDAADDREDGNREERQRRRLEAQVKVPCRRVVDPPVTDRI